MDGCDKGQGETTELPHTLHSSPPYFFLTRLVPSWSLLVLDSRKSLFCLIFSRSLSLSFQLFPFDSFIPYTLFSYTPSITSTMSKIFTQADVSSHNKPDSLWIVVDGDVYDVTKFADDHPGMSLCAKPPFSVYSPRRKLEKLTVRESEQVARRSSRELVARTPPSSSGSTTTRASSRSTRPSSRSAP